MNQMQQTTLAVGGMTCRSCVFHVDVALKEVEGVGAVEVNLREGRVAVTHAAGTPVQQLIETLREAGYEARVA